MNDSGFASEMACRKTTLMAKQRSTIANKLAQVAKNAIPKSRQTTATRKTPRKQLAAKVPQKQVRGQGVKTKPHHNYAMIA